MIRQAVTRNALILGLFAIGTAAALALTNQATLPRVECNRQRALIDSLAQVMPGDHHDNVLINDRLEVRDPRLGPGARSIYRARRGGEPSGAVLEVTAPDGYGGAIDLIVGVDADGRVLGVRAVPPHHETPGLGDKIERRKSDWITTFNGRSLKNPEIDGWAVKKDGGAFDSFTGATITPRAVVNAVHRGLLYFRDHRRELLRTPPADNTIDTTADTALDTAGGSCRG